MRTSLLCLLAACGTAPAPEELLADVPRTDDLAPRGIGDVAAAGAAQRDYAPLYLVVRRTSAQLNGVVAAPLDLVWRIAATPPTLAADGSAVWGPLGDALSPAVYRLVARRTAPDQVSYVVDGRPKDGSDDFRPIVVGTAGPSGGTVAVDFTRARALDPVAGFDQDGGMAATYQRAPDHADVALELRAGGSTAAYVYTVARDGSGGMDFGATLADMGAVAISARWAADGSGMARARAADGGARTDCWDALGAAVACPGSNE
jgi:hypothetical protein